MTDYEIGDTISTTVEFDLPFLCGSNEVEFEKVGESEWKPLYRWNDDEECIPIKKNDSLLLFDKVYLDDNDIRYLKCDDTCDLMEEIICL
jgi:hypothetical protein